MVFFFRRKFHIIYSKVSFNFFKVDLASKKWPLIFWKQPHAQHVDNLQAYEDHCRLYNISSFRNPNINILTVKLLDNSLV